MQTLPYFKELPTFNLTSAESIKSALLNAQRATYEFPQSEQAQLILSNIQKFTSELMQRESVQSSLKALEKPTKNFIILMGVNELFKVCNRTPLAIFVITNKFIKEILDRFSPPITDQITTQERIDHLKKKIDRSENPEAIRNSFACTVATAFLLVKLLQWTLANAAAEKLTGKALKIHEIGTLFILKEALFFGASKAALSAYKKLLNN